MTIGHLAYPKDGDGTVGRSTTRSSFVRGKIPVILFLAAMVLAVFGQVGGHSFLIYDDYEYVYENPHVREGLTPGGVAWAFTTNDAANWHPLTWLSHMADVSMFGMDAGRHLWTNVLLHVLNAVLLFLVLERMTGAVWRSGLAAALFAAHPLHVESVAWVAERKDLLCALFWFLTMGAYLRYVRKPGIGRYLSVVAAFVLALLSKPMAVTLPIVLLILDLWPLGRIPGISAAPAAVPITVPAVGLHRLVLEKIPLLSLSFASCVVTFLVQRSGGAVGTFEAIPLTARASNAAVSYASYLWKTICPAGLSVFYPHPWTVTRSIPVLPVVLAVLFLSAATVACVWQIKRRPFITAGWFWYLVTLVPVIGIIQVGAQAMADRYTYLPLVGIFVALAWGIPELPADRRKERIAAGAAGIVVLLALAASSRVQVGYWKNDSTLFAHATEATKNNWLAWNNLGTVHRGLGRPFEAAAAFREALRIKPNYDQAWYNLGLVNGEIGEYSLAVEDYRKALDISPGFAKAWNNLGVAYQSLGKPVAAVDAFREAVRSKPDFEEAWYNLGTILGNLGDDKQAVDALREALRLRPDHAESWYNLGTIHRIRGRYPQAVDAYREAVRIKPDYASAWNNLGVVHGSLGQHSRAVEAYREAVRIRPDDAVAWTNLGVSYQKLGMRQQALEVFRKLRRPGPSATKIDLTPAIH